RVLDNLSQPGQSTMPAQAVVTLRYGPYSAVGLSVEHRTYRLQGLQAVLAKDGHQIILEQIEDWNLVELVVNEETVFQCDIQELEFGGDGKLDPLCEEARIAVLNAF
ncbi:RIKEN cDNA 1700024G13, partial [Mus musculus]